MPADTPIGLTVSEVDIDAALRLMQSLDQRTWTPRSRRHVGQLAWSRYYAMPEKLNHPDPRVWLDHSHDPAGRVVAWGWAEARRTSRSRSTRRTHAQTGSPPRS